MSSRYDIAQDHNDETGFRGGWYVVDTRTLREPNAYGVNVDVVAGAFPSGKPSLAAKMRDWMNLSYWQRATTPCPNRASLLFALPLRDARKTWLRWGALRSQKEESADG